MTLEDGTTMKSAPQDLSPHSIQIVPFGTYVVSCCHATADYSDWASEANLPRFPPFRAPQFPRYN
jgi:hypothetical protein